MELNVKEITCEQQCHCFLSSKYISQVTEQQNKRWKRCYANNAKFHWKTSKSIALIHFKFVHPAYVPTFLFAVSVINQYLHLICDERLFLRFTQLVTAPLLLK